MLIITAGFHHRHDNTDYGCQHCLEDIPCFYGHGKNFYLLINKRRTPANDDVLELRIRSHHLLRLS